MEQNTSNPELEQVLKEEKDLFNVLWVNIVQNLKETLRDRLLNKKNLCMQILKDVGCRVEFDCPLENATCRRVRETTLFNLSNIYNQCKFDVKIGKYVAHMVFSNTRRRIDPIIIEFNYKGAQQFSRPRGKHIIVVPVTFDMDLAVFDNGLFAEGDEEGNINCKYINFSVPALPRHPARFMAFPSGKSVVIGNVTENTCHNMYSKHNVNSLLEIVFPYKEDTSFELYQMGLVECKQRSVEKISYCSICKNLKNVWGSGSKPECIVYKDHALPRHPNDYTIIDCPQFALCENYNKLRRQLEKTPHIVHPTK